MKPGSVLVDVAIDQGGCFETSRPTTHSEPTYEVDGIVHYCVANMPGAVPMTSTRALTNATLPYVEAIAGRGLAGAVRIDRTLARGVNVMAGKRHLRARRARPRASVHPALRDRGRRARSSQAEARHNGDVRPAPHSCFSRSRAGRSGRSERQRPGSGGTPTTLVIRVKRTSRELQRRSPAEGREQRRSLSRPRRTDKRAKQFGKGDGAVVGARLRHHRRDGREDGLHRRNRDRCRAGRSASRGVLEPHVGSGHAARRSPGEPAGTHGPAARS